MLEEKNEKIGLTCLIAYAPGDEAYVTEFNNHLKLLIKSNSITSWSAQEVKAGEEWQQEVIARIENSDIIFFIVTSMFISSDFCLDIQMKNALAKHKSGETVVVPILANFCDWKSAPFSHLQHLPKNSEPIDSRHWKSKDEAFANIVEEVKRTVKSVTERKENQLVTFNKEILKKKEYLQQIESKILDINNNLSRIEDMEKKFFSDPLGAIRYIRNSERIALIIKRISNEKLSSNVSFGIVQGIFNAANDLKFVQSILRSLEELEEIRKDSDSLFGN